MGENVNEPYKWDRYDYAFVLFRIAVFAAVAITSGFFMYNGVLYILSYSKGTTPGFIISIIYIGFWLVFLTGVAMYLIFFTRNTFKLYHEMKDDDTVTEETEVL